MDLDLSIRLCCFNPDYFHEDVNWSLFSARDGNNLLMAIFLVLDVFLRECAC